MDIGTGIFLSTLVIGVVALYGITKDRWNWRRLVKRAAFACLGVVLLGVVAGAGWYVYRQVQPVVSRQTEYAAVRLGMGQDEVRYIKGDPPTVMAKDEGLVFQTSELAKGKSASDYREWFYNEHHRTIYIAFSDARTVASIACLSDDKARRCPAIAGIVDGDPETKVLQMLGNKPQAVIHEGAKSLVYPEIGVELILTKEQVYMLKVGSPGRR